MELFLTPASISFITQTILFLGITIYLVIIRTHTRANYWLAGFYTVMVASSLAGFLAVSSLEWYDLAMAVENTLIVIALQLLIQFAYTFPEIDPAKRKQARVILFLSLAISVLAIISVIFYVIRIEIGAFHEVLPIIFKSIQILMLVWIIYLFLSLTLQPTQNTKGTSAKTRFIQPQGRVARAARGFFLASTGLLLFWIASTVLEIFGQVSVAFYIFSLGTSWALTIFIFTLINQTTRKASFLIKLIGIVMLTVFTGIGVAAWLAAPVSQANYHASYAIPDKQTIRFEQTNATYTISQSEYIFDAELGRKLVFSDGQTVTSENLLTSFPFAGVNWSSVQIDRRGYALFDENPLQEIQLTLPHQPQPIIAALFLKNLNLSDNNAVFAHLTDEKSVFTWFLVSPLDDPDATVTAQLSLFPDGSFDISYAGIRSNFRYSPYLPIGLQQISGFFLGENDQTPSRIQFNTQLPYTSQTWSGVYQDYYIDFRSVLHQSMLMQLYGLLLVTLVSILIFPIFLQNSLWTPIKALRSGIQQVMQGDFETSLEPRYNDEIGQTLLDFNKMVTHLDLQKQQQQNHVHELEEKLTHRAADLKVSIEKLTQEIEARKKLTAALEKTVNQHKKLAVSDELTGVFNRAHLVSICDDEIKRAKRYNTPLSFILMDPDYLRMINETYGNTTGDEVLKSLAQFVNQKLRETDSLGRIGGEEFAIILPQTTGSDALIAANRLRNLIGSQMMETNKGPIRISASFGVVEMPTEGIISVDIFLHRANQAVDQAKQAGRNTAVLWTSQLEKRPKS